MATTVPSQEELYELYKDTVQAFVPELTDFEDGAINDAMAGGFSVGGEELAKLIIDKFNKTFFATAHGPEVTGGPDDLELLAKDHFGETFARPAAVAATGTVDFSRPTTTAGNVVIPIGTVVKTNADANGNEQLFQVTAAVTMTGLAISASVEAVEPGTDGNANSSTVINVESSLTDTSVVVTNPLSFTGGSAIQSDSAYREFIRNKVEIIRGATKAAIEAAASNVSGVEIASAVEDLQTVIEWDIGGSATVGDFFFIPRVRLFIADANGTANQALVDSVDEAILPVRACGVRVNVIGATPLPMDWTASLSLNPSGPNFAELSTDTARVVSTMEQYVRDLDIGSDFDRGLARLAILEVWGPTGTDDLTDFTTSIPAGTIDVTFPVKLIPGTVGTA